MKVLQVTVEIIGTDYYAAPNCNALCSSGSGTPKANGTQECSCIEINKATLVAGRHSANYGYSKSLGYGSLKPDTYKGIKIQRFSSFSSNFSDKQKSTSIAFESLSNIPDTLKIKINGTVYDFVKTTSDTSIFWKFNGRIFHNGETYTIEFLN